MSNPLTRFLSTPVSKPYRSKDIHHLAKDEHPVVDDDGFLIFGPGDIENPQNWSVTRRWLIMLPGVLLVMNATFASSAPSGTLRGITEEFQVSEEASALTITLFLLGYVAGPLIFAPLSEFYGRRYVFLITFILYLAFNFLCAFAPNFGSLLVGRFLTGTFCAAPLTNVPGVMADIWNKLERNKAMALFSSLLWIGPALGPLIAGFLQLKEDWRWSFYVILMLGGVSVIPMFTIPETYGPVLLAKKAARIRAAKIPGFENVQGRLEAQGSLLHSFRIALTRPWQILFDPISFLCAIYLSVVYTLLYMLFSIYPIVFQEKRGWNSGVGELPLLGTVVGAIIGGCAVFYENSLRVKKITSGKCKMEDLEPEDRLPLAMVGGVGFAVSMFWFAWSAEYNSVHWIVPTLAGVFLTSSLLFLFVAYLSYLVDTYLMYAASAMAANTIARSACASAGPLFTRQMFKAMGVGGGGSLIGGLAALLAIIPFLFYRYGRQIRIKSKFAPTAEKNKNRQPDEERDAGQSGSENTRDESTSSRSSMTAHSHTGGEEEKKAQLREDDNGVQSKEKAEQ